MTRAAYLKVTSDAEFKLYTHRPGKATAPLFAGLAGRGTGAAGELRYRAGACEDRSKCRGSEYFQTDLRGAKAGLAT